MLKELHDKLLSDYGLCLDMRPVYYSIDNCIRFEVGVNTNKSITYEDDAYLRAKKIYDELFNNNNVLIMYDNYIEDKKELEYMSGKLLKNFTDESFKLDDELHSSVNSTRFLFKLNSNDIKVDALIKGIVRSESETGDDYYFSSSVYIFNLDTNMMFYLYGDRGLDIASVELTSLKPLYNKYKSWLLSEVLIDLGSELDDK